MPPIAILAGIDGQHIDNAVFFVDFVKKTITTNSIPPRLRLVIFQFLDVLSKMGIVPKLRIDVISKFFGDPFALSLEILRQVLKKLIGLKYLEFTQPTCLSS